MIASIGLSTGDTDIDCSVTDFSDYSHLIDEIMHHLPLEIQLGTLKPRFSRALNRFYMSNGCAHCDALFGAHYEIHSRYDEYVASEFTGEADGEWNRIFDALLASKDGHLH